MIRIKPDLWVRRSRPEGHHSDQEKELWRTILHIRSRLARSSDHGEQSRSYFFVAPSRKTLRPEHHISSEDWREHRNPRMSEEACVAHKNPVRHGIHDQSMGAIMGANQI